MINVDTLECLTGLVVNRAWMGVGSFLVIDMKTRDASNLRGSIWTYFCDWALTKNGIEIASSDAINSTKSLNEIVGLEFNNYVMVDHEEVHLDFTGNVRLEIWENVPEYGIHAEAIKLFKGGNYIASLEF